MAKFNQSTKSKMFQRARQSERAGTANKFAPPSLPSTTRADSSTVEPGRGTTTGEVTPEVKTETQALFSNSASSIFGEFSQAEIDKIKQSNNDIFYNPSSGEFVWRKGDKRVVIGGDNEGVDQKWIDFAEKEFARASGRGRLDEEAQDAEALGAVAKPGEAPEGDIVPEVTAEMPEETAELEGRGAELTDTGAEVMTEEPDAATDTQVEPGVIESTSPVVPDITEDQRIVSPGPGQGPEGVDTTPPVAPSNVQIYGEQEGQKITQMESQAAQSVGQDKIDDARYALATGALSPEQYKAYIEKVAPSAEEKLVEATSGEIDYQVPADIQAANFFDSIPSDNPGSFASGIAQFGDPTTQSSAEIMANMVASMQIDIADTQLMQSMAVFSNMRDRAIQAYNSTINSSAAALEEIDAIDRGLSDIATTAESLSVRIAKRSEDLGVASLQAQESYLKQEYEITYSQMAEQNARLEGYMKAKLTYMGAIDSSAGLTTIGLVMTKAQQNLLLYQGQFTRDMVALELKKSELMGNYFDAVQQQVLNIQSTQGQALSALTTRLDEIDSEELASAAEANTMKMDAISNLTDDLYKIQTEQRDWEWKLYTDQWDMAMEETKFVNDLQQQAKTDAYKNLTLMLQSGMGKSFGQLPADLQQSMMDMASVAGLPQSYVSEALSAQNRALRSNVKKSANQYGLSDVTATLVADSVSAVLNGDVSWGEATALLSGLPSADAEPAFQLFADTANYYMQNPLDHFTDGQEFGGPSFIPSEVLDVGAKSRFATQEFDYREAVKGFVSGKIE